MDSIENEDTNWEEMICRLLVLAQRTHRRYYLHLSERNIEPQDLVQEAIVRFFSGCRKRKRGLDLFVFLGGTIKSIASHHLEKALRRDCLSHDFNASIIFKPNIDDENKRLKLLSEKIEEETIISFLKGDELLCKIVRLVFSDYEIKPREIADELSISIQEIYNAYKRLRRKLDNYFGGNSAYFHN